MHTYQTPIYLQQTELSILANESKTIVASIMACSEAMLGT